MIFIPRVVCFLFLRQGSGIENSKKRLIKILRNPIFIPVREKKIKLYIEIVSVVVLFLNSKWYEHFLLQKYKSLLLSFGSQTTISYIKSYIKIHIKYYIKKRLFVKVTVICKCSSITDSEPHLSHRLRKKILSGCL